MMGMMSFRVFAREFLDLIFKLWVLFDKTVRAVLDWIVGLQLSRAAAFFLRTLWTCRVAVISLIIGAVVLSVPQARDLFVDLSHTSRSIDDQASITWDMWWHAVVVGVFLTMTWAAPVFIVAVWAIDNKVKWHWEREKKALEGHEHDPFRERYLSTLQQPSRIERWVPVLLGATPYCLMLLTIWSFRPPHGQLFQADMHPWSGVAINQLLALFVVISTLLLGFLFLAISYRLLKAKMAANSRVQTLLLALIPFHVPDDRQRAAARHDRWQLWMFLLFGALFFYAFWLVLEPQGLANENRLRLLPLVFGGWIPLLYLLTYFSSRTGFPLTFAVFALVVFIGAGSGERHSIRLFDPTASDPLTGRRYDNPAGQYGALSDEQPREDESTRRQMVFARAVLMWMRSQPGECGDMHIIDDLLKKGDAALYKHLSDKLPIDTTGCPDPVIVAAAGGASRAAFQTVSVLGHLLDITCFRRKERVITRNAQGEPIGSYNPDEVVIPGRCSQPPEFANRLFAISGVSGGAYGAAVYAAAWANSRHPDGHYRQPCRTDYPEALKDWFKDRRIETWRDCLQAIVSGDYLSPVAIGLAFRDQVPIGTGKESDRAALLENGWISRFADLMHPSTIFKDVRGNEIHGHRLSNSFGTFLPTPEQWRPLLVMNGTSATTGRRLLTSHFKPTLNPDPAREGGGPDQADFSERLFPEALDLRELVNHGKSRGANDLTRRCKFLYPNVSLGSLEVNNWDVSLATAATNSARFPVISPPGTIGCAYPSPFNLTSRSDIFDKVLDGGYFENYGLGTATDLLVALKSKPFGFRPIVITISNEPMTSADWKSLFDASRRPPPDPDAQEFSLFDWAVSPFRGLYKTRDARGFDAFGRAKKELATPSAARTVKRVSQRGRANIVSDDAPSDVLTTLYDEGVIRSSQFGPRIHHFAVFHDDDAGKVPSNVSMSWWLSKPVQEFLDNQLPRNPFVSPVQLDDPNEPVGRCINRNEFLRLCHHMGTGAFCARALKLNDRPDGHFTNGGTVLRRKDTRDEPVTNASSLVPWINRCVVDLGERGNRAP